MTRKIILLSVILAGALISCNSGHLIKDEAYREAVLNDYEVRKNRLPSVSGNIFDIAPGIKDTKLREAAQFMAAYMPLNDIADCDPYFIITGAGLALNTRTEMPWGKKIPDDIFLHFVLPLRVNNENLDSFRIVCYD